DFPDGRGHRVVDGRHLFRLEMGEDVIRHVGLVPGTADADLHTTDLLGAERLDHRTDTIVAAVTALHADADRPERQVHLVADDNEVVGDSVVAAEDPTHDGAGD